MKSKAIFILFLPLLIAATCQKDVEKSEAISAIPARSAFVVRINNLHQLAQDLSASVPGDALKKSVVFADLDEFVNLLDDHRSDKNSNIKAFGAYDQYGADSFGWIWCAESDQLPFISKSTLEKKGTLKARTYGSGEIVHFTSKKLSFYFALQNGLLLLSKEENLIEASLKQLESGIDLQGDASFMETLKTTNSKDPVNVFVHYASLPEWLECVLVDQTLWPANLATWSAFDLDINPNDINFTGISMVPDSSASYLGLFKDCGSTGNQFTQIIPENTALAVSQNCGNMAAWHKNFTKYLGKQNKLKTHQGQLAALNVNPAEWIAFTDGEIGTFYSDGAQTSAQSKNGFIRISSLEAALPVLQKSSGEYSEIYRDISIKKLTTRHALPLIYGKLFSFLSEPYWFTHGNWIIFCNDLANAKSTINSLLAEKTWANQSDFEAVESLRDSDANILVIAKNPEWLNLAKKELQPELAKKIAKTKKSLENINWTLVQIKQKGDAAYSEVVLIHQEKTAVSAKQFWGVELNGEAIIRPQLVLNHVTNTKEVLVQDESNTLYLINPLGEVLWKKPLDGPILGEVAQVDIFKNNKLQFAFNTAQTFYLVDRNGNDVEGFPAKLPQTATAPMASFDYDKSRNYRFVIACGKQLYNYGIEGKPVEGWAFAKAKANLVLQPKHATIGDKDFIYTLDQAGNVYVLNRKGEVREAINTKLTNLVSGIYLVTDQTGGKLSALGHSGYTLNLTVTAILDSLQPFNQKPIFMHVDGKTQLFASKNEVYIRSNAGNIDLELDQEILAEPRMYNVGNQTYFAVTTAENQVWIFDSAGKPLPGMPLYGSGLATVGKTDGADLHVIVATPDGAIIDYKLGE